MRSAWMVAVALALVAPGGLAAQETGTYVVSRKHAGEDRLRAEIEFAAGELDVRPAPAGTLYRAAFEYDASRKRPVVEYSPGSLRLGLGGDAGSTGRRQPRTRLDVSLSPDALLDLEVGVGAARAEIELGGLRLERVQVGTGASETVVHFSEPNPARASRVKVGAGAAALRLHRIGNANAARLEVDGGVGDVHLDFGGEWRGDLEAEVRMGLGSLTLELPRDVGVRIIRETFLASFDPRGLEARGDGHYSTNWDAASHRLTVRIGAAFGAIDVRWSGDD